MQKLLVGLIDDDSGAAVADLALITVVLPIWCIVLLAAYGISMITGASLLSVPNVIMEIFDANLLGR